MARAATGRVTLVFSARVGGRTRKSRRVAARVAHGRFRASVKLDARLRGARRGTLQIAYAGDSAHRAGTLRRAVAAR